jgi:hypothetical protein
MTSCSTLVVPPTVYSGKYRNQVARTTVCRWCSCTHSRNVWGRVSYGFIHVFGGLLSWQEGEIDIPGRLWVVGKRESTSFNCKFKLKCKFQYSCTIAVQNGPQRRDSMVWVCVDDGDCWSLYRRNPPHRYPVRRCRRRRLPSLLLQRERHAGTSLLRHHASFSLLLLLLLLLLFLLTIVSRRGCSMAVHLPAFSGCCMFYVQRPS